MKEHVQLNYPLRSCKYIKFIDGLIIQQVEKLEKSISAGTMPYLAQECQHLAGNGHVSCDHVISLF